MSARALILTRQGEGLRPGRGSWSQNLIASAIVVFSAASCRRHPRRPAADPAGATLVPPLPQGRRCATTISRSSSSGVACDPVAVAVDVVVVSADDADGAGVFGAIAGAAGTVIVDGGGVQAGAAVVRVTNLVTLA